MAEATPLSPDFIVNTTTAGNQGEPSVARLPSGGFVVAWSEPTSGSLGILVQRFDAAGNRIGGEILANTTTASIQQHPSVLALPTGGFVVTWSDVSGTQPDPTGWGIRGQVFDSNGARVGGEFLVNTKTADNQWAPESYALADGGFVVVWENWTQGSVPDHRAQRFDASGSKVGGEFVLGLWSAAVFPAAAGGGFQAVSVGTVEGGPPSNPTIQYNIRLQTYDAAGNPVGPAQYLTNWTTDLIREVSAIRLSDGGYAVAWLGFGNNQGDGSGSYIRVRVFNEFGAPYGDSVFAATALAGNQTELELTAFAGGFTATWTDSSGQGGDSSNTGIKAQLFDNMGAKMGSELLVNSKTVSQQLLPDVDTLTNGNLVFVWQDHNGQDYDIRARIFTPPAVPQVGTEGDDSFTGTLGPDDFSGLNGDDTFLFPRVGGSATFSVQDRVDGGGGTRDTLILEGSVLAAFQPATMRFVEKIILRSNDGDGYAYFNLRLDDANLGSTLLTVDGSALRFGESLMFYGINETEGWFDITGGASNDYLFGGHRTDSFRPGLGDDTLGGREDGDNFYFEPLNGAATFSAADRIDGGPNGNHPSPFGPGGGQNPDRLHLYGQLIVNFEAATITNVEEIWLNSSSGNGYAYYNLVLHDGNVAAGATLSVQGQHLLYGESLLFYGQNETDGSFNLVGGANDDFLFGGRQADFLQGNAGRDYLQGNGGADVYLFSNFFVGTPISSSTSFDTIVGFDRREDRIRGVDEVTSFGGEVTQGRLAQATFDQDLASAMNGVLNSHQAALFTPDQGDYAGRTFLIIDGNQQAGYQAGQDYVIEMVNPVVPLGPAIDYFG